MDRSIRLGREEAVEALLDAIQIMSVERDTDQMVRSLLSCVRDWTGFEAVGLRLREGCDYPYFQVQGFPEEFVAMENSLCVRNCDGSAVLDSVGNPVIECMCGNVIRGRADPSLPFFTPGGSFWTNSTTDLLASTTEADRQARTRNRCNGEGYESVALIPLRASGETIGLLQLNDTRRDRLDLFTISTLERIAGAVGMTIVERWSTEALRASEGTMRYIVKYDPNALAVFDRDMRYLAVSDRFLKDYDVRGEDVMGKYHYEVFPETPERWKKIHRRVLAGGVERSESDSFERPDGSTTYNNWECRPWYEPDGTIGGLIMYTEVTTDRVLAEMALKQSEERYRMLFEMESDAIVMVDVNSEAVIEVNSAACSLLGYTHDEWCSLKYTDVLVESKKTQAAPQGGDSPVPTCRHRTKDGSVILVEISSRYFDLNGRNTLIAAIRDVTERERAAEALRESEALLRQSSKMEAVGQLAGGIAHDFNNLLTSILGYSELILAGEGDAGEDLLADVAEIKAAATRASALTRQILAFSRRQMLKPEVASLNDTVRNAEKLLSRTLGENVSVTTHLHPEPWLVEVDIPQIEQVLMNLALNSRDAMPDGGSLIIETANVELDADYCRANPDATPGRHVMLAVTDTGTGMDEDTKSHAFEPFFTTKEQGKGTGLGLSTMYGTVRQSGGSVFVDSGPGDGTRIEIYLPAVETPSETRPASEVVSEAAKGTGTVLLVEDHEAVRVLAKRVLAGLGYQVIEAVDGDEALVLAGDGERSIDLLLSDVVLPGGMNGVQLAEAMCVTRPGLKVLFMSGYPRDTVLHVGRIDPGVNYLAKPFTPDALARKVRAVLED